MCVSVCNRDFQRKIYWHTIEHIQISADDGRPFRYSNLAHQLPIDGADTVLTNCAINLINRCWLCALDSHSIVRRYTILGRITRSWKNKYTGWLFNMFIVNRTYCRADHGRYGTIRGRARKWEICVCARRAEVTTPQEIRKATQKQRVRTPHIHYFIMVRCIRFIQLVDRSAYHHRTSTCRALPL